jgi:hypothetical protein
MPGGSLRVFRFGGDEGEEFRKRPIHFPPWKVASW